jgi:hypothetical protein
MPFVWNALLPTTMSPPDNSSASASGSKRHARPSSDSPKPASSQSLRSSSKPRRAWSLLIRCLIVPAVRQKLQRPVQISGASSLRGCDAVPHGDRVRSSVGSRAPDVRPSSNDRSRSYDVVDFGEIRVSTWLRQNRSGGGRRSSLRVFGQHERSKPAGSSWRAFRCKRAPTKNPDPGAGRGVEVLKALNVARSG